MISDRFPDLLALPDEDKLQLAEELWKAVIGDTEDSDLVALIQARLADYREHPQRVSPWADVKARLLASRR